MQEDSKIHERRCDLAWKSSRPELGDHTNGRGHLQRRAEDYGMTKGACKGLGVIGLMEDLGGHECRSCWRQTLQLRRDTSAAKGIASRKGVGKVKHLETRTLWVQDQVERGWLKIKKFDGVHPRCGCADEVLVGSSSLQCWSR